jgi:hypothetical protein
MNQEYRGRVKRHLEAGGDPKYVNVKKKATVRHEALKKGITLPKENVQEAVSYKKSRSHRLLVEQQKRISEKYNR